MGNYLYWGAASQTHGQVIRDTYRSLEELQVALRQAGLESCNLILAVDYTRSNLETGRRTFGGCCLHDIRPDCLNPYQSAIRLLGQTLEPFDDDKLIPAMGFGDKRTTDRSVFWFNQGAPCQGFAQVLTDYTAQMPFVELSGPTSFAAPIYAALDVVKRTGQFHLLVILADGQVTDVNATEKAIVEASGYALSILVVGVGDGPWDEMRRYDDELPQRQFDNFQFVEFHEMMTKYDGGPVAFTTAALAELPAQYRAIRRLGLLGRRDRLGSL